MRKWLSRLWLSPIRLASRHPQRYRPQLEALENRLAPAVITVTTTADDITPNDGSVSLREAITAINAGNDLGDPDIIAQNPTATNPFGTNDTIKFNISGTAPFQISVGSDASAANIALPVITQPVVIDATTQPGFVSTPVVVVNGNQAGVGADGFDINLSAGGFNNGATIKGFVINQFNANGIRIEADGVAGIGNTDNTITGNYIGTNVLGTVGLGNQENGILIDATDSNNVGLAASDNVISNNVISGNGKDGVLIQAHNGVAAGNTLTGNMIGTNAPGTAALANSNDGVTIDGASGNVIGTTSGTRNVMSGNGADGIHIVGTLTNAAVINTVVNNFVGVDGSGNVSLGNQLFGIEVSGGNQNTIGGATAAARNVVGANATGIEVDNGGQSNIIQGNSSGVGADGVSPVGNKLHGIVLRSDDGLSPPLGPGQPNEPGVQNNLVGGTGAGEGNLVEFNGTGGIAVFGNPVAASGGPNTGNAIEGNSIFENGRSNPTFLLGIDLTNGFAFPKDDGLTPNDSKGHGAANDPNNFQNFPVLTLVTPVNGGGTTITGSLMQSISPNTMFRIEFFASNADPLNGVAEGQTFLGFTNVTTDGSGNRSFSVTVAGSVAPGQLVTATATDIAAGNTSEFSAAVTAPTANQLFVDKVYHDLLGRVPDPGGYAGWTAVLSNGASGAQVVLAIETDPGHEYYTKLVQSFYQLYLKRAEGPSEGSGAVNSLAAGGTIEQLQAIFTASPEYFEVRGGSSNTGFVNALYLDAFNTPNRVASDSGAASFVQQLDNKNITRAQVSALIFGSTEYQDDLVQSYYQLFLQRIGAAAEINGWAGLLQMGVADQVVIAGILGSPEAFADASKSQPQAPAFGSAVVNGQADLNGPLFGNIPLNGRASLQNVYAFRSPADIAQVPNFGNTVLAVTVSPFPGALTPLSFDPRTTLTLNVVNVVGHLSADMSFQVTFAPPVPAGSTFNQVVTLKLIQGNTTTTIAQYTYTGNQTIPPAVFANNITFPGDAIATGKFIAGVFDDPAFIDAQGLTNNLKNPSDSAHPFPRPLPTNPANPEPTDAKNFFANGNTLGFLLEVPTTKLTTATPPLLGVWATSAVNGTQVARMGRPDINALLIPPDPRNDLSRGERRTAFNQGSPATDVAGFRADMQAVLINLFGNSAARAAALTDSALGATIVGPNTGLLPDILTVDLTKLYADATNGFPNGLRFRDDATDIMLQIIENNPAATDNVADDNGAIITDGQKGSTIAFPYIGRPNQPPGGPNP